MFWILLLIILGLILFFAELVLLPGITIAAVGSFIALTSAVAWAYSAYGAIIGTLTLIIVLVCVIIMTAVFLRPTTWKKASLQTKLENAFDTPINSKVKIGAQGTAITRLAPMGKVIIDGAIYEAKSQTNYVDQQTQIEVIGYENFSLIVNPLKQ